MDVPWLQLGLVGVLVLVNAGFAGTELALVSLHESQLRRLEERSATGAVLARLARDSNRFLATIQIGITLAGFLASASAAVTLAEPVQDLIEGPLGRAARPMSVVAVTVVLSYLTLVLGELAPKRLAMQRAERWGLVTARPLAAMAVITRPVVWLLSESTDLVVRLFGGDPSRDREEVTIDDLRDQVITGGGLSPQHRRILTGAFEIPDRTLEQVMQPRPDVYVLDSSRPCQEALTELSASGHSRAPVAADATLDEVVGVVHLRDLVGAPSGATVGSVASEPTLFPESVPALRALRQMQNGHVQMAVVVDEHGSAAGIVTVEDLVEELVGEIWDESDLGSAVRRLPNRTVEVSGRHPVHELPDVGVEVPEGDYTTVAGFLLAELQRLPDAPGDVVTTERWCFEVTGVDDRAITDVRISPRPEA